MSENDIEEGRCYLLDEICTHFDLIKELYKKGEAGSFCIRCMLSRIIVLLESQ